MTSVHILFETVNFKIWKGEFAEMVYNFTDYKLLGCK